MPVGLVGKKCGMTRIFTEEGSSIPVTVIEVKPNFIAQVKTVEKDCYRGLQLAVVDPAIKSSRVNKPTAGHLAKAGVAPALRFHEFRLDDEEYADAKSGDQLSVEMFKEGQYVDVQGVSKGKGFAGGIKRHGFRRQDETHGNSLSHRAPGSIGQNQTPGRVFKGKKMAGRMGNVNRTVQSQQVIKIDTQRQLIMVKGAIPGAPGGVVIINHAVKKREQ